jgi:uncharacterized membrane protein YkvI
MSVLKALHDWIQATPPSLLLQKNEAWFMPVMQSIHIAGIGVVLACVLMMTLRVLGVAGGDRTVLQTQERFGPWLTGALWLMLATGLLIILCEPRAIDTVSFWMKMFLVVVGALVAWAFQRSVHAHAAEWDGTLARKGSVKAMAIATLVVWIAIIFLGRFIAYDQIWGKLSPSVSTGSIQ